MKNVKLLAVAAGLSLFSVVGFADNLPFSSIQASNSAVLDNVSCAEAAGGAFTAEVSSAGYDEEVGDYVFESVFVKDGPAECEGAEMTMTVLDHDGNSIAQVRTEELAYNQWNGAFTVFGSYTWQNLPTSDIASLAFLLEGDVPVEFSLDVE